jgi:hypothetical protein
MPSFRSFDVIFVTTDDELRHEQGLLRQALLHAGLAAALTASQASWVDCEENDY